MRSLQPGRPQNLNKPAWIKEAEMKKTISVFASMIIFFIIATNVFAQDFMLAMTTQKVYLQKNAHADDDLANRFTKFKKIDFKINQATASFSEAEPSLTAKKDLMGTVYVQGTYGNFNASSLYSLMKEVCLINRQYVQAQAPDRTIRWDRDYFGVFISTRPSSYGFSNSNRTNIMSGIQMTFKH